MKCICGEKLILVRVMSEHASHSVDEDGNVDPVAESHGRRADIYYAFCPECSDDYKVEVETDSNDYPITANFSLDK